MKKLMRVVVVLFLCVTGLMGIVATKGTAYAHEPPVPVAGPTSGELPPVAGPTSGELQPVAGPTSGGLLPSQHYEQGWDNGVSIRPGYEQEFQNSISQAQGESFWTHLSRLDQTNRKWLQHYQEGTLQPGERPFVPFVRKGQISAGEDYASNTDKLGKIYAALGGLGGGLAGGPPGAFAGSSYGLIKCLQASMMNDCLRHLKIYQSAGQP